MAKVGRPTKYDAETMLPILEELAAGRGAFMEQIAKKLGISKVALYEWLNPEEGNYQGIEFVNAVKDVQDARDAWLLDRAQDFVDGEQAEKANASVLIFTLKNVLNWRDRTEIEQTNREIVIED